MGFERRKKIWPTNCAFFSRVIRNTGIFFLASYVFTFLLDIVSSLEFHAVLRLIYSLLDKTLHCSSHYWNMRRVVIGKNVWHTIVNIFLPISLNMSFGCSKESSHWDGSIEYPQHMFWLRNKKMNFWLRTLISKGLVAQYLFYEKSVLKIKIFGKQSTCTQRMSK